MNREEQRLREQYVDVNFDISWEEISNKILNGNMEYLQGAQDVLHYFMSQALLDKDFINKMYNCLELTFQQQTVNLDNIFKAQCHDESKHFEDYMNPPEGKNHFANMYGTMLTPEESREPDPCEVPDNYGNYNCPFDSNGPDDCRRHCGVGVDE